MTATCRTNESQVHTPINHFGLSLDVQNKTIAYLEKIINERHAKSKS